MKIDGSRQADTELALSKAWCTRPGTKGVGGAGQGLFAHIIIMKNMLFGWTVLGAAVRPKASASVSIRCTRLVQEWARAGCSGGAHA